MSVKEKYKRPRPTEIRGGVDLWIVPNYPGDNRNRLAVIDSVNTPIYLNEEEAERIANWLFLYARWKRGIDDART